MDNAILKVIYKIVSELSEPFNIYVMKNGIWNIIVPTMIK